MKQLCRTGLALLVLSMLSSSDVGRAWAQAPDAPAAKPDAPSCKRETFRVLVDVGHTVEVPGAISARGVTEYEFNLRLAKEIEQKLIEAGFAKTVLLITAGKARRGLFKRVAHANQRRRPTCSCRSITTRCPTVQGEMGIRGPGSASSATGSTAIPSSSPTERRSQRQPRVRQAARAMQLKARGLHYTPHYTERFMGSRRRELVDADAGVYRYDQLIVLKAHAHAGGAAGSRLDRQPR